MQAVSPSPADRLSALIVRIVYAVDWRRIGNNGGFIPMPLFILISDRLRGIGQRFRLLADRLQAGWTYRPKPYAPRIAAAAPPSDKPADRPPGKLPTGPAWLRHLAPGQDMTHIAAELFALLAEPEMAAVLAAAPGPAWRILRPLCRMMGVERPASLKLPPRPRPAKPVKRRKAKAPKPPQPAPKPQGPWLRIPSAHWPKGVIDRGRRTS